MTFYLSVIEAMSSNLSGAIITKPHSMHANILHNFFTLLSFFNVYLFIHIILFTLLLPPGPG